LFIICWDDIPFDPFRKCRWCRGSSKHSARFICDESVCRNYEDIEKRMVSGTGRGANAKDTNRDRHREEQLRSTHLPMPMMALTARAVAVAKESKNFIVVT